MKYLIITLIVLTGCSSTPLEKKQATILECVKDLKGHDTETLEAYEVCRQVYRLKKVKE